MSSRAIFCLFLFGLDAILHLPCMDKLNKQKTQQLKTPWNIFQLLNKEKFLHVQSRGSFNSKLFNIIMLKLRYNKFDNKSIWNKITFHHNYKRLCVLCFSFSLIIVSVSEKVSILNKFESAGVFQETA